MPHYLPPPGPGLYNRCPVPYMHTLATLCWDHGPGREDGPPGSPLGPQCHLFQSVTVKIGPEDTGRL